jgi:hypothetical protein
MDLHTIDIDQGKRVFPLVGLTCAARLWCARSSRENKCCFSRRTCQSN